MSRYLYFGLSALHLGLLIKLTRYSIKCAFPYGDVSGVGADVGVGVGGSGVIAQP
jgi:hypothetical protein